MSWVLLRRRQAGRTLTTVGRRDLRTRSHLRKDRVGGVPATGELCAGNGRLLARASAKNRQRFQIRPSSRNGLTQTLVRNVNQSFRKCSCRINGLATRTVLALQPRVNVWGMLTISANPLTLTRRSGLRSALLSRCSIEPFAARSRQQCLARELESPRCHACVTRHGSAEYQIAHDWVC